MATRSAGQQLLEKLQLSVYSSLGWLPQGSNASTGQGEGVELPTRFEDPRRYRILRGLAEEVEQFAKANSLTTPSNCVLGTLPTGRLNAMTIPVPSSGEYLVVFESEMFDFAARMSQQVFAGVTPFMTMKSDNDVELVIPRSDAQVEETVGQNDSIIRAFRDIIIAYLLEGRPSSAPSY